MAEQIKYGQSSYRVSFYAWTDPHQFQVDGQNQT